MWVSRPWNHNHPPSRTFTALILRPQPNPCIIYQSSRAVPEEIVKVPFRAVGGNKLTTRHRMTCLQIQLEHIFVQLRKTLQAIRVTASHSKHLVDALASQGVHTSQTMARVVSQRPCLNCFRNGLELSWAVCWRCVDYDALWALVGALPLPVSLSMHSIQQQV